MEIVIRATVIFFLLWALLRAIGKRELTEVTPFELVIIVVLGDIVQQGITQEDMSMTGAALAATTVCLLAVLTSIVAQRWPRTRPILEGHPSVLVRHGEIIRPTIRSLRMTVDEVHEAARKQGHASLDELAWVILEDDGDYSFITESDDTD